MMTNDSAATASSKNPGRREHSIQVFVSHEFKDQLKTLARKYNRSVADIVRAILKIGIPMFESLSDAEETMVREYVELFRRLRRVRTLKDI